MIFDKYYHLYVYCGTCFTKLASSFMSKLFPAKTLFCRELWFHPKKNCVRLSSLSLLSSLTESSPGFKALPIIRLSWAFNMLFLGTKLPQIRSFIKIGPPEGAPRPPSGGTSKNTKNAITLSFCTWPKLCFARYYVFTLKKSCPLSSSLLLSTKVA